MQWPHYVISQSTKNFSLNLQNPAYFLPLVVSIFQGEKVSLHRDPGAEMKPCSVSGGQG